MEENCCSAEYGHFERLMYEGNKILRNYEMAIEGEGVLTLGEVKEDFLDWKLKFYEELRRDLIGILNKN